MNESSKHERLSVSDFALFAGVPAGIIAHIEKQCTWHRHDVNELIIETKSKRPHGVFFLVEGEVELFETSCNNECMPIVKLNSPECFGEFGAVGSETGSAGVRATTPCVLAEMSSEQFLGLLNACPAAPLNLVEKVVSRIKNVGQLRKV